MEELELTADQKKEIYKKINEYVNSEDYKKVLDYAEKKEQEYLEKVREERESRRKVVAEYSDLSRMEAYGEYMLDISKQFDKSEWGEILRKEFYWQYEIVENNIEVKEVNKETGDLPDMPLYTKLDILKVSRRCYKMIVSKIAEIHNLYLLDKPKGTDLDPYEED